MEAAIAEFRDNFGAELDDETIDAINEAEEQVDGGEGTELDEFRVRISERFRLD